MLKEFYDTHPNKTLLGKVKSNKLLLNKYQVEHMNGTRNIYEPIEAYSEKWEHGNAKPIEGTRRRNDLPPLYIQWKEDWRVRWGKMTST